MPRPLKYYPSVVIDPETISDKLSFSDLFGRNAPVHIEIGSGKGTFIVTQATAQPDADFLGIEWASKYYRYAIDRVGRWSLKNVRLLRTDAAIFLADHVNDQSVSVIHLYFPDPWPKKRHHKRRFVNQSNIEQVYRILVPKGVFKMATDHADYFEQMQTVVKENSEKFEIVEFLPTAGAQTGEWVGTNFERKYLKEERSVYTLAVMKKALTSPI
ncbi:MAG: tRNA (guanosine(46)-N7)-methyltransferase TrmB [Phycisphaerae bacterium]|nr:tRNA (guanosine(46)-N7)-methyltransferase TrmB [Phycisphaerae bacterium]